MRVVETQIRHILYIQGCSELTKLIRTCTPVISQNLEEADTRTEVSLREKWVFKKNNVV
jgi:hypothetical protein